jgi:glycosyltransferase involved in cell wall biosynthesis
MNLSVALATFNGERFLEQQLASFANQTLQPTELVVCDDGSTDGTSGIVEQFARDAPFPVQLGVNDEHK